MKETPRLGLPLLASGQAQKEIFHNEALLAIDCRLQSAVLTRSLSVPPVAPVPGALYLVGPGAAGDWIGRADWLACWEGPGWRFLPPVAGSLIWIADEQAFSVYDGGWSQGSWPAHGLTSGGREMLTAAPEEIALPSGGPVVDEECRVALASLLAALRNQGIVL